MLLDTYYIQFLRCRDDVPSRMGIDVVKVERIIDTSKAVATAGDADLEHFGSQYFSSG